jgi:DNA-binding transcriptional ArsR family regulator
MGEGPPALLPLFRSENQLTLMGELYVHAGQPRSLAELSSRTGISKAVVSREINRLEEAGLVRSERRGRLRLVDASTDLPYFRELQSILLKTVGPAAKLRAHLDGLPGIDAAYIFGSWAARYQGEPGRPPADIDLLVVGDPDLDQLYRACREAAKELGLSVNPVVRTAQEWEAASDGFLAELRARPLVRVSDEF